MIVNKDASGTQLFEYGNMGEVTKQTRIYTLPFMLQKVKLETRFEYDSWGRTLNMTYPDGEKVTCSYDYGGMLKSVHGRKDTSQYNYLENMQYNRFGAKMRVEYGNRMTTAYSYNPQNLRLHEQNVYTWATNGQLFWLQDCFYTLYAYDPKGNITGINTSSFILPDFSSDETFSYDEADQLDSASSNNYTVKMSYGNYGRINTNNTTFTDPQTSITTQLSNSYAYQTTDAPSNSFAPVSGNNTTFEYGINGSLRKKAKGDTTEYYLYNAFDQMKAYSNNGETYGYYEYDDKGQRSYKVQLKTFVNNTSAYPNTKILEVEKLMLYPNGYININQNGEYTKHYYADEARIASKIGSGYVYAITAGSDSLKMVEAFELMQKELGEVTNDTVDNISCNFEQITHLEGDSNKFEEGLYFYHGNHLSSTQLITNMHGAVQQAVLYTPWGNVISEYRADWMLDTIPRYLWNGKERDEESNLDYFEARYYSSDDGSFRSRDPLFEKFPTMSPYAYTDNNPVRYIDPTGLYKDEGDATEARDKAVAKYGKDNVGQVYQNNKGKYEFRISQTGFKQDRGDDVPKGSHASADGGTKIKSNFKMFFYNIAHSLGGFHFTADNGQNQENRTGDGNNKSLDGSGFIRATPDYRYDDDKTNSPYSQTNTSEPKSEPEQDGWFFEYPHPQDSSKTQYRYARTRKDSAKAARNLKGMGIKIDTIKPSYKVR